MAAEPNSNNLKHYISIRIHSGMSDEDQGITEEQIERVIKNFRGAQGYIRANIGKEKKKKRKKD